MYYGWIVVAASLVIGVCGYGTYFSFTLFYPHLVAEFAWSRAGISGAMSLGLITYGFFAWPMGWCADRFGPRVTVIVGGLLFGCGTALTAALTDIWQLYALYGGIAAVGMGAVWSPLVSTVSRWFVARRGMALGIATLGSGSGIFFVAPVAEFLIVNLGWRDAYLYLGAGAGTLIVALALLLCRDPAEKGLRPYGLNSSQPEAISQPASDAPQVENHMSLAAVTRTWLFWRMCLTLGLWWFAGATVYVQIAPYMLEKNLSSSITALIVTGFGAGNCIGRVVFGIICDRVGARNAFQVSVLLTAVFLAALATTHQANSLVVIAVLLGFGIGGGSTQITTITVSLFGVKSIGALLGAVLGLMGLLGAGGPLVSGLIYDYYGSYELAFLLAAAVYCISLLLSIRLR